MTPKYTPLHHLCYHTKFCNSVTKGARVNRKEHPKMGSADIPPFGCMRGCTSKTSPLSIIMCYYVFSVFTFQKRLMLFCLSESAAMSLLHLSLHSGEISLSLFFSSRCILAVIYFVFSINTFLRISVLFRIFTCAP